VIDLFTFRDLDQQTRDLMLNEFEADLAADKVYLSTRFTDRGKADYYNLMRAAISGGDAMSLAAELHQNDRMTDTELRLGKPVNAPFTKAETFAEGEFNRYYIRAICLRAVAHGSNEVRVYRAKQVANARPTSVALIDTCLPAQTLLDDVRIHMGKSPTLGFPGPNSGISVECVCGSCAPSNGSSY
jgi:hypothetical protein